MAIFVTPTRHLTVLHPTLGNKKIAKLQNLFTTMKLKKLVWKKPQFVWKNHNRYLSRNSIKTIYSGFSFVFQCHDVFDGHKFSFYWKQNIILNDKKLQNPTCQNNNAIIAVIFVIFVLGYGSMVKSRLYTLFEKAWI